MSFNKFVFILAVAAIKVGIVGEIVSICFHQTMPRIFTSTMQLNSGFVCRQLSIPWQPMGCVSRTPCHIACADADTLSAHHVALIPCTSYPCLKTHELCAHDHLLFRAMSHDLHSTPSILSSLSLFCFSFVHRLRLKVDHVQNTLRRFTRPWRWRFYGSWTSHSLWAQKDCRQPDRHWPRDWALWRESDSKNLRIRAKNWNTTRSLHQRTRLLSSTQDSIESLATLEEADLDEQIRALLALLRYLLEREASAERSQFVTLKKEGLMSSSSQSLNFIGTGNPVAWLSHQKRLSQDEFSERESNLLFFIHG